MQKEGVRSWYEICTGANRKGKGCEHVEECHAVDEAMHHGDVLAGNADRPLQDLHPPHSACSSNNSNRTHSAYISKQRCMHPTAQTLGIKTACTSRVHALSQLWHSAPHCLPSRADLHYFNLETSGMFNCRAESPSILGWFGQIIALCSSAQDGG